jgi:hypothetical protein
MIQRRWFEEAASMNASDINEFYHVVVRRGAAGRKPFIWEIKRKTTEQVLRTSPESFASLEEAHISGMAAIVKLER